MSLADKIKSYLAPILALFSAYIGYRFSENRQKVESLKEAVDEKEQIIEDIKESVEIDSVIDELSTDDIHERLRKYYRD